MGSAGEHDRRPPEARWRGDVRSQRSDRRAGVDDFGKEPRGNASRARHLLGPLAGRGAQELGRGGERPLRHRASRHHVADQIGDEQNPSRRIETVRASLSVRGQLKQSVEREELETGGGENLLPRAALENLFHDAIGAAVSIVHGSPDQLAIAIEKAVVDAPAIHCDAAHISACPLGGDGQSSADLEPEARKVPAQRVEHLNRLVEEAVELFQSKHPALESPEHDASTLGA